MRILVVAATALEVAPLLAWPRPAGTTVREPIDGADTRLVPALSPFDRTKTGYTRAGHQITVLITGVGMVATAVWCSRALAGGRYDLALNLGVCGSFDRALQPGCVVHVTTDRLVEMGAEDGERFLTIQELQLLGDDEFPFTRGRLVNATPPRVAPLRGLPAVDGITVSTAHGDERSIAAVVERFAPQVESMEGAAFMYACLVQRVSFAQVRAVSNVVERRNRAAWNLAEATAALASAASAIIEAL